MSSILFLALVELLCYAYVHIYKCVIYRHGHVHNLIKIIIQNK